MCNEDFELTFIFIVSSINVYDKIEYVIKFNFHDMNFISYQSK